MTDRKDDFLKRESCARPVFLISPTPRSGTNYISNLVVRSGVCERPKNYLISAEDWIIASSRGLFEFRDNIANYWSMLKLIDENECLSEANKLLKRIGETLINEIVYGTDEGFVITKTPSSDCISNIDYIFPNSKIIFLVRDGRDTCYSAIKSGFASSVRGAFRLWAYRVDQMIEYAGIPEYDKVGGNYMWIRYEFAFQNAIEQLQRVETYLGVSATEEQRSKVRQLDIVGSCEFSNSKDRKFKYTIVPFRADFNPIGRWKEWSTELRQEFKENAGSQLIKLGYEKDDNW
ncbi:sulfotransferase [Mesorhizobium marinum]|uniref:sulfotransferase n=1 Tax=Mesorhizobium marinum TaxID=3228790 RepID=UPI0034679227